MTLTVTVMDYAMRSAGNRVIRLLGCDETSVRLNPRIKPGSFLDMILCVPTRSYSGIFLTCI